LIERAMRTQSEIEFVICMKNKTADSLVKTANAKALNRKFREADQDLELLRIKRAEIKALEWVLNEQ